MYVDDACIIGGVELCGRVKAKLRELRELKIQGILQNEQLGLYSGARVTLEGEEFRSSLKSRTWACKLVAIRRESSCTKKPGFAQRS